MNSSKSEEIKKIGDWTIRFGKHKGEQFKNLETSYLRFLYEKTNMFNSNDEKYKDTNDKIRKYITVYRL